jgi:hypothetical protein
MELIANLIGIVVIAVVATIAIGISKKYARRRVGEVPALGKLNVPCDPDLHTDFLNALTGEKIRFVPPTQVEPVPLTLGDKRDLPMCVVLVAEADLARAEQILAGFQQKWFPRE